MRFCHLVKVWKNSINIMWLGNNKLSPSFCPFVLPFYPTKKHPSHSRAESRVENLRSHIHGPGSKLCILLSRQVSLDKPLVSHSLFPHVKILSSHLPPRLVVRIQLYHKHLKGSVLQDGQVRLPVFKFQLHLNLSIQIYTSCLKPARLSFLIYKVGMIVPSSQSCPKD